jgi:hypothetical protein
VLVVAVARVCRWVAALTTAELHYALFNVRKRVLC